MDTQRIRYWARGKMPALLAAIGLVCLFIWDSVETARLDARFESGIGLDTTVAEIEFTRKWWWQKKQWWARYQTYDGYETRARFLPRFEYPRNPYHGERIKIVYLKDEVEENRWIIQK